MAKRKTTRTPVGSPLTPELLKSLHALRRFEFPPAPKDFDPNRNWTSAYRIWACRGYRESGNQNVGFLQIARSVDLADKTFTLKVHQEVVQTDALLNIIDAHIKCLNNRLASPIQWNLVSLFINADNKLLNELRTEEKGLIKQDVMCVETNGRNLRRKVTEQFTCDWGLFDAVQRLKFDKKSSLSFDMLQDLSLLKKKQRLSYRGAYPMMLGQKKINLYRFDQLGHGILPYEYWLDDKHRLLTAISMNKVYILDNQAPKVTRQRTEQLRKSYKTIKNARRK